MVKTEHVNGNRVNGTVSQMPPPDLDQLRTDAAVAAGRLLSGLHGEQARLRAQLERIEREIGLTERAAMGELAALAIDPPNGQHRNGWGFPAAADPVIAVIDPAPLRELADELTAEDNDPPAELGYGGWQAAGDGPVGRPGPQGVQVLKPDIGDTPVSEILEPLANGLKMSLLADCDFRNIRTVNQLADHLKQEERYTLVEFCSAPKEAEYFRAQLRLFFTARGWAANRLGIDGMPREWFGVEPEAEKTKPKQKKQPAPEPEVAVSSDELRASAKSKVDGKPKKVRAPANYEIRGHRPAPGLTAPEPTGGWTVDTLMAAAASCDTLVAYLLTCLDCRAARHESSSCPLCNSTRSEPYGAIYQRLKNREEGRHADSAPPVPTADLDGLAASGQSWKPADLLEALEPQLTSWKRLKEMGAPDELLTVTIARVFGDPALAHSGDGYSVAVSKKLGPQFWSTAAGYKSKRPATLAGPSLLAAARAVLQIGEPKQ